MWALVPCGSVMTTAAMDGDAERSRVHSRIVDDLPPRRIMLLVDSVIFTDELLYVAVQPAEIVHH